MNASTLGLAHRSVRTVSAATHASVIHTTYWRQMDGCAELLVGLPYYMHIVYL